MDIRSEVRKEVMVVDMKDFIWKSSHRRMLNLCLEELKSFQT